jgi:hypothetical protein
MLLIVKPVAREKGGRKKGGGAEDQEIIRGVARLVESRESRPENPGPKVPFSRPAPTKIKRADDLHQHNLN